MSASNRPTAARRAGPETPESMLTPGPTAARRAGFGSLGGLSEQAIAGAVVTGSQLDACLAATTCLISTLDAGHVKLLIPGEMLSRNVGSAEGLPKMYVERCRPLWPTADEPRTQMPQ